MEGNLSMKDSISFNKLPLSQAIRRLVGTKNFLMIYESSDSENNGKIKEIRIKCKYKNRLYKFKLNSYCFKDV